MLRVNSNKTSAHRKLNDDPRKGKSKVDIEARLLDSALEGIGDGAGLAFSTSGDYIKDFVDISGDPPTDSFSSEFASGYFEFSQKKQQLRTKVSYSMSGCICRDVSCQRTAAVDLFGVRQADNGELKGYTPILLQDENGKDVPCLTGVAKPSPPASAIKYSGCSRKMNTNTTADRTAESSSGDPYRFVIDCEDGEIENLRLHDTTKGDVVFGRALTNLEVIPELSGADPEASLTSLMESFQLKPFVLDIEDFLFLDLGLLGTWNVPVQIVKDLTPELNSVITSTATSILDGIGNVRPNDFNSEVGLASETKLHEFARLSDAFDLSRLSNSVHKPSNQTVHEWSLHGDGVGAHPDASSAHEVLSDGGIVMVSAAVFGASVGTFWRHTINRSRSKKHFVQVFFSSIFFIFEVSSFAISWMGENEQNSYSVAMAMVEVAAGSRFGNFLPLQVGLDGIMMVKTTLTVEISDDSSNLTWLYIIVSVLSILALASSTFYGRWNDID